MRPDDWLLFCPLYSLQPLAIGFLFSSLYFSVSHFPLCWVNRFLVSFLDLSIKTPFLFLSGPFQSSLWKKPAISSPFQVVPFICCEPHAIQLYTPNVTCPFDWHRLEFNSIRFLRQRLHSQTQNNRIRARTSYDDFEKMATFMALFEIMQDWKSTRALTSYLVHDVTSLSVSFGWV